MSRTGFSLLLLLVLGVTAYGIVALGVSIFRGEAQPGSVGVLAVLASAWLLFVVRLFCGPLGRTTLEMDAATLTIRRHVFGRVVWRTRYPLDKISDIAAETRLGNPTAILVHLEGCEEPVKLGETLSSEDTAWVFWELRSFWLRVAGPRPAQEEQAEEEREPDLRPPEGTRITFTGDLKTGGRFKVPAVGPLRVSPPVVLLTVAFTAFVVAVPSVEKVWPSVMGIVMVALFGLVGAVLWWEILRTAFTSATIDFDAGGLLLCRRWLLLRRCTAIPYDTIRSVELQRVPTGPPTWRSPVRERRPTGKKVRGTPQGVIFHGTRKTLVAELADPAEQRWLVGLLKTIVAREAPGSRVPGEQAERELRRPVGSRIKFAGSLERGARLVIPAGGVRSFGFGLLVRVIVVLGMTVFVTIWCWGAARYVLPLVFSIIFWVVIAYMWFGILRAIFERQVIELRGGRIRIRRRRPVLSRTVTIPCTSVKAVRLEATEEGSDFYGAPGEAVTDPDGEKSGIPQVVIVHGSTETYLAEFASEAEKRWIAALLRAFVGKATGRKP
jgi:hypothetical protein